LNDRYLVRNLTRDGINKTVSKVVCCLSSSCEVREGLVVAIRRWRGRRLLRTLEEFGEQLKDVADELCAHSLARVVCKQKMASHPSKTGQVGKHVRVIAKVPARVSIMIPGWDRSTIVISLAQIDPQEAALEIETWRSGYSTEDDCAGEESGEAHVNRDVWQRAYEGLRELN
jgi:hypothetical protein